MVQFKYNTEAPFLHVIYNVKHQFHKCVEIVQAKLSSGGHNPLLLGATDHLLCSQCFILLPDQLSTLMMFLVIILLPSLTLLIH